MIIEWIKKHKGTPLFKFIILILVLIFLKLGITVHNAINGTNDKKDNAQEKSVIEQIISPEDENGNKITIFDIKIGWSNIIMLSACVVALIVIEKKKDKGTEEQITVHHNPIDYDNRDEE